jgi:hypothetical protein
VVGVLHSRTSSIVVARDSWLRTYGEYIGHVHSAYNPSFSAETIFFSHNKLANNVFQTAYQHSRMTPYTLSVSDLEVV